MSILLAPNSTQTNPTNPSRHVSTAPTIPPTKPVTPKTEPRRKVRLFNSFWVLVTLGIILLLANVTVQCRMAHPNMRAVLAAHTPEQQRAAMREGEAR